jgi:hypothetical protein
VEKQNMKKEENKNADKVGASQKKMRESAKKEEEGYLRYSP